MLLHCYFVFNTDKLNLRPPFFKNQLSMSIVNFVLPFLVDPFPMPWATPRSVSFRGLIQNFRRAYPPLSHAESFPPGCHCGESCVAWVWVPARRRHIWVEFVILWVLQDSLLLKNQLSQIPTRSGMCGHIWKSATWVKKLQNSQLKIMLYQFSRAWLYLAAFAIFRSYLWHLSSFYW